MVFWWDCCVLNLLFGFDAVLDIGLLFYYLFGLVCLF